jgi:hypothetical protein
MGDVVQTSKDEYSAWTGGKPKPDWSGLDPTAPTSYMSPNQFRPIARSSQTSYNYRCTGFETKFTSSDDVTLFAEKTWRHFEDTGLDTISYLPDIQDPLTMSSVIVDHARFPLDIVVNESKIAFAKFDSYDRSNDQAAKRFLFSSLEADLETKVWERVKQSDPFTLVWATFISLITSSSIEKYDRLKESMRQRSPGQYPGQNLHQLASDFRRDAKLLIKAGQYDHNLTLVMLKSFIQAGGQDTNGHAFRTPLYLIKERLDKAIAHISFMDKAASQAYMIQEKLTYEDICKKVEDDYKNCFDNSLWSPAKHAVDSKAVPTKPFANLANVLKGKELHMYNLVQTLSAAGIDVPIHVPTPKPGTCNNCGEEGHWARECPKPRRSQGGGRGGRGRGPPNSNRSNSNGNGGRRFGSGDSKSWRFKPPGPGEPSTKTHETRKFKWCGKCGRWTTTHDTNTHTGSKNKANSTTAPQANFGLVPDIQDPSAWHFPSPRPFDMLNFLSMLLLQSLLPMAIGALLVIGLTYDVATIMECVFSFGRYLATLGNLWWQHKQYSGVILWFVLINVAVFWKPDMITPRRDTRPRWMRRAELKAWRRATKPRRRFIRVRRKAPKLPMQRLIEDVAAMHIKVLRILRCVSVLPSPRTPARSHAPAPSPDPTGMPNRKPSQARPRQTVPTGCR